MQETFILVSGDLIALKKYERRSKALFPEDHDCWMFLGLRQTFDTFETALLLDQSGRIVTLNAYYLDFYEVISNVREN